ncbi:hypothetical protein K0M31_004514 [Melipona bicolor]|uniref:Uncharacterized protein n=1 Tax=Melipona bicolor TaxID=60889 RepID=A0AA40FWY2_9HYME|nr:hypothetical protein K0M31_004514 [Melipona bicolor]
MKPFRFAQSLLMYKISMNGQRSRLEKFREKGKRRAADVIHCGCKSEKMGRADLRKMGKPTKRKDRAGRKEEKTETKDFDERRRTRRKSERKATLSIVSDELENGRPL